jgi:tRNA(fMet)-specific endonuclease VapC
MTVGYLLDTNTASYIIKGRSSAARSRFREAVERDPESVSISSITEAELRYGLRRRPEAHTLRTAVEKFLDKISILPWGSDEASAYAELRAKLESMGPSLSAHDMLIAAHAVAIGSILAADDKAFSHLMGLVQTERWATDIAPSQLKP